MLVKSFSASDSHRAEWISPVRFTCTSCPLLEALPDTNFVEAFAELYPSRFASFQSLLYPSSPSFSFFFLSFFFFITSVRFFLPTSSLISSRVGALKHRSHRIITRVSFILLLYPVSKFHVPSGRLLLATATLRAILLHPCHSRASSFFPCSFGLANCTCP